MIAFCTSFLSNVHELTIFVKCAEYTPIFTVYSISNLIFDHRTGEKMDTTDTTSLAEEEFCILCKVGTQPAPPAVLSSYLLVAFSFSSENTIITYHKPHILLVISTLAILLNYFCVYQFPYRGLLGRQ